MANRAARVDSGRRARDRAEGRGLTVARTLGGLALLVVAGVHLEQYTVAHFSVIPTIGPLFLANFIAAMVVGLFLLLRVGPVSRGIPLLLDALAALAGIGVAAGALVALFISEYVSLFGFMEHGYRTEIVIAIGAELAAIAALSVVVVRAAGVVRGRGAAGRNSHLTAVPPGAH